MVETVGQGKPFSPLAKRTEHFFSHKKMYMEDPVLPPKEIKKEPRPFETLEVPMKLGYSGRSGNYGSFNKFPEYMENPKPEVVRKEVDEDAKPGVKLGMKEKARPTPSIALNVRNLKA